MNQKFLFPIQSSAVRLFVIACLFSFLAGITPVNAEGSQGPIPQTVISGPIGGCPMFPADNIWNMPVDNLPVHARSDQWVNTIGRNTGFHMDFGSGTWAGGPIGIPYNVIGSGVPKVSVSFYYPSESDSG